MYKKIMKCSVGVMAYNEESNIANILKALLSQRLMQARINEIIVVSSGSTDSTNQIVTEISKENKKVSLIIQEERRGKSSAINLFIDKSKSDFLVLISADTIPEKHAIERLLRPFYNEKIGMTGGRPMPINSPKSLTGFAVNLLWKLHHNMALFQPKLGEMVAFRKVFKQIPEKSAVDEASIECIIKACGFETIYVADAIVKNKGPENIKDFIKQRKRIAIGHIWLKKNYNYNVTSNDLSLLLYLYIKECICFPLNFIKISATAKLEIYSRMLAMIDFHFKKSNPFIWDISKSTKNLKDNE